jgi:uridylate kinase
LKLVTKVGGSLFRHNLDHQRIGSYAKILRNIHKQGHQVVVVAGGGECARTYIGTARALGTNEAQCDQIAIQVTRLNAQLLISAIGDDAFPEVAESVEDLRKYFTAGRIVVMGGLQPAQSTDAVAAIVAESIGADLLVKTIDAPGICTKDPKKHPDAKILTEISVQELLKMIRDKPMIAGSYELMDPIAVRVIERSKIPCWVVSGDDPVNIKKVLDGEHVGTRIVA